MSAPVPPTEADRLLTAMRLLIRQEIPNLTYCGTYEYSVQSVNGSTLDLSPVDTTIPVPSITNVPIQSSVLAETMSGIQSGQLVLVQFVNADPARPEVVGFSEINSTLNIDATSTVTLGSSQTTAVALAGGTAPVARQGDLVNIIVPIPQPAPISGTFNGAIGFTGTIAGIPPGMSGIVTGGFPPVNA